MLCADFWLGAWPGKVGRVGDLRRMAVSFKTAGDPYW